MKKRIVVSEEISTLIYQPVQIFKKLAAQLEGGAIFESGKLLSNAQHFSFLAFEPYAKFQVNGSTVVQEINGQTNISALKGNPFQILRKFISKLNFENNADYGEYATQAIGFLGYDAIRYFEDIPDQHTADEMLPDILLNFYKTTLTYDFNQKKLFLNVLVETGDDSESVRQAAQEKIEQIRSWISEPTTFTSSCIQVIPQILGEPDINDNDFKLLIKQAKNYIERGDAFQIVLSRCFTKKYSTEPINIYYSLHQISPSPYMFYLPLEDRVVIGASPERMIGVHNNVVTINPIAGTRRRNDEMQDEEIEYELLHNEKELAEHIMLVDLARNDLGRICKPGSIKLVELMQVRHYSHISHITSNISGILDEGYDVFDAIGATFPAGTLSGAPKIRAMQIIDKLEKSRRGLYGGAIFKLDYAGNFDSCIAIRMATLKEGLANVRTGAGIVHDSDPEAEVQETWQKSRAVLEAISFAEQCHE